MRSFLGYSVPNPCSTAHVSGGFLNRKEKIMRHYETSSWYTLIKALRFLPWMKRYNPPWRCVRQNFTVLEDWGRRHLATRSKKFPKAHYCLMNIRMRIKRLLEEAGSRFSFQRRDFCVSQTLLKKRSDHRAFCHRMSGNDGQKKAPSRVKKKSRKSRKELEAEVPAEVEARSVFRIINNLNQESFLWHVHIRRKKKVAVQRWRLQS